MFCFLQLLFNEARPKHFVHSQETDHYFSCVLRKQQTVLFCSIMMSFEGAPPPASSLPRSSPPSLPPRPPPTPTSPFLQATKTVFEVKRCHYFAYFSIKRRKFANLPFWPATAFYKLIWRLVPFSRRSLHLSGVKALRCSFGFVSARSHIWQQSMNARIMLLFS